MTTTPHSPQFSDENVRGLSYFATPAAPWIVQVTRDVSRIKGKVLQWCALQQQCRVFDLDGAHMKTLDGFYGELTKKLNLPTHAGKNLNALSECLTDADVLDGASFVVWIDNSEDVLRDEKNETIEGFRDVLRSVAAEWATPMENGNDWDRGAKAFHVVFAYSVDALGHKAELPLLEIE